MKKRILSALLATLMLASILSGCGGKQNDSTRVWKFSHTRAEGTDNDVMANKFASSLMENIEGLQIDMYPNNQLGDYTVVQEAVGLNEVQLMLGSMSNGVDPTLSVQIAPYLVNNWEDAYEFYNSENGIITKLCPREPGEAEHPPAGGYAQILRRDHDHQARLQH